jgi:hypothetical protein
MKTQISLNWPDGSSYMGEGLDSIPDGLGLYTTSLGVQYDGLWSKGFSIFLFRNCMQKYLEERCPYRDYIQKQHLEINAFIEDQFSKITTSTPLHELKIAYLNSKRIFASSETLLGDFYEYLRYDVSTLSTSKEFGNREFSCGGNFQNLERIKDDVISSALLISPYLDFFDAHNRMYRLNDRFRKYLELGVHYDENEKRLISKFIQRSVQEASKDWIALPGSTIYFLSHEPPINLEAESAVVLWSNEEWAQVQIHNRPIVKIKLNLISREYGGKDCLQGLNDAQNLALS